MAIPFKIFLKTLFTKYLFVTNTCISSSLLAVGDLTQQAIGIKVNKNGKEYDYLRTARLATMGIVLGPMNTFWYKWLDNRLPGSGFRTVIKKILFDQASCPAFSITFITGVTILEGHSIPYALQEYKNKFPYIYMLDWIVWPPTQMLNFLWLPPQFRVCYLSVVALFYNTVISYIKHTDSQYGFYEWEVPPHYEHFFDNQAPAPLDSNRETHCNFEY